MADASQNTRPNFPSAFDLLRPSIECIQNNLGAFVGVSLVPTLLFALTEFSSKGRSGASYTGATLSLTAIAALYGLVMLAAGPYLQLRAAQGQRLSFAEAVSQSFKYYWRLLGLYILVGLLVLGGLILFIVPGLIMLRRYFLAAFFLIDRDLPIREAMRQSAETTKPYSGAVWGVIGVTILFGLTGIIPVVGAAISAILQFLYLCAPALRYNQLNAAGKTTA